MHMRRVDDEYITAGPYLVYCYYNHGNKHNNNIITFMDHNNNCQLHGYVIIIYNSKLPVSGNFYRQTLYRLF
jgi:hypothetical protein